MKFISIFTGYMPVGLFIAAMIFALAGFTLYKTIQAKKATTKNRENFNWGYWFRDNIDEFFTHLLLIYLLVRFLPGSIQYLMPGVSDFLTQADSMIVYVFCGYIAAMPVSKLKKFIKNRFSK